MKQRNYGIDFLRIISMMMITTLHILGHGGILKATNPFSANYEIAWFLEIAVYCSVNCYALISGYVGVEGNFKYVNIINLWFQVFFYSIGITIIFFFLLPEAITTKTWLKAIFPATMGQYWYFTAYFCMFFFIPYLNHFLNTASRKQSRRLLITVVLLFSILPTLVQEDVFGALKGYSPVWLVLMYLIGGYLKKYRNPAPKKKEIYLLVYFFCISVTWLSKLALEYLGIHFQQIFGAHAGLLINYTSPTMLLAAVALLLFFSECRFKPFSKKLICVLAPLTFGVYLIHEHPLVRKYAVKGVLHDHLVPYAVRSPIEFFFVVVGCIILIYLLCSFVEFIRTQLFRVLQIKKISGCFMEAAKRGRNKLRQINNTNSVNTSK